MAGLTREKDRLDGWKAIAAHMGRDERTLMRWETTRGLPIRRMPGEGKVSVFAYRTDLDAWMVGTPPEDALHPVAPEPAPPTAQRPLAPARAPPRSRWWLALPALAIAGAIAIALPVTHAGRAPPPAVSADPQAPALYLQGRYLWNRRTPASLDEAATAFGAAIARDPRYAAAYAGLPDAYLLMREFGTLSNAQAFPRASAAADAALALDPSLVAAQRARAFVRFWWLQDQPGGLAAFRAAIALAPADAQTHHWYATALTAAGDQATALAEIEAARRLDPVSNAILTDRGLILFQSGHVDEARAALAELVANEPKLAAAHAYLAGVLLARGDPAGFLHEALSDARLRRDPVAEAVYAPGLDELMHTGRTAMLQAVAARAERAFSQGRFDTLGVARLEAIAGHDARARALAKVAADRHDVGAFSAASDHWLSAAGVRRASSG